MRASHFVSMVSLGLAGAALPACTALLGVGDLEVDPTFTDDDGGVEASADGHVGPDGASDANQPDTACTSECPTEGFSLCSDTQVKHCTKVGDCLKWSTPEDCGKDQICCGRDGGGACIPVSTNDCYACGATCAAPAPACLPIPKKCGCNVALCAAQAMGCDTSTGACATCTALTANAADFYVDATSFAGGTGTVTCPFLTITGALAAAAKSTATTKTIHVAAGTYSAGETFPLQVRGVDLIGAGADTTIIKGEGIYDHSTEGGQFAATNLSLTVLFGDHDKPSTLAGVTLKPATPSTTTDVNHLGILCDRGNYTVPMAANTAPMTMPPSSFLRDSVVDTGYYYATVISTTSTSVSSIPYSSGCNVKITGTTYAGGIGVGIWALGAGRDGSNGHAQYPVGLVFGEDGQAKNTVKSFVTTDATNAFGAAGIVAWDGVTVLNVVNSVFDSNDVGYATTQHAAVPAAFFNHFEVRTSTFTKNTRHAINIDNSARFAVFNDNTFTGNTSPTGTAIALYIETDNATAADANAPGVVIARRNKFVGNDNGVVYANTRTATPDVKIGWKQDWGTTADPGLNVFRCNGAPTTVTGGKGYDVRISSGASVQMSFVGNQWDHAPATETGAADPTTLANAMDVAYKTDVTVPDVSNASIATDACPAGRTP